MNIGIIGIGHMGQAMIKGLKNFYNAKDIYAMNPVNPRISRFQKQIGFNLYHHYSDLEAKPLDVLILTTPAAITIHILEQLKDLNPNTIILSAAAGIKIVTIKQILPNNPIVTMIPNIPVAVNRGTIGVALNGLKLSQQKTVTKFLQTLGEVVPVSENQLSIVGTVGGCGPAFVDVFMEAMSDVAVENGLSRKLAHQAIASMVEGSGALMKHSAKSPADLKDEVTSPGGTTIKGVIALESGSFRKALMDAVNKANHN